MTILTIPKKQFEKDIGKIDEKMEERIAMFGTPVEQINDEEISIEIFPNRPDLLAYQNYKKAFLSFLGKNKIFRKLNVKSSGEKMVVEKSVPKEWPYAYACIVKGLKLDDSKIKEIIDIQEKLGMILLRKRKKGGIGLYPLDKINFPIKLKGMEPNEIKFRPLEYPEEITGKQILSKHSTGREYAPIVEGWEKLPVFVDSKNVIMSMPPIINSHDVGKIDETTKDVFIEVTGTDSNVIKSALNILVLALEEMGGKIYSIDCVQQDGKKAKIPDFAPKKIKLKIENAHKFLGIYLKEIDVKNLLLKMGLEYKKGVVEVPSYRIDVLHEVDVIEDIAIAYGYDNFVPEIPDFASIGSLDKKSIVKEKIAQILSGLSLQEVSSYHLTNKEFQLKKLGDKSEFVEVLDSKTDYNILRKDLSHYMLRIFYENSDVEYPQEIFQIGKVFSGKDGLDERDNLAISLAPGNFTKLKQIIEYLGKMLGVELAISKPSLKISENNNYFIDGRFAEIKFGDRVLGFLGEVHPKTLKSFKIKMPVALCEINLDELFKKLI